MRHDMREQKTKAQGLGVTAPNPCRTNILINQPSFIDVEQFHGHEEFLLFNLLIL